MRFTSSEVFGRSCAPDKSLDVQLVLLVATQQTHNENSTEMKAKRNILNKD